MKITDRIFSVSTPELALAAASFLASRGVKLDANIKIETYANGYAAFFDQAVIAIRVSCEGKLASWCNKEQQKDHFTNLPSLLKYLNAPQVQFPRVGEYDVTHDERGINVGCTHVPWGTLDEIVRVAAIARKTIDQA